MQWENRKAGRTPPCATGLGYRFTVPRLVVVTRQRGDVPRGSQRGWLGRSGAAPLLGGGLFCGVVAAHAVDSAAWWRGGRADIEVADGGGVVAPGGAEEELAEIYGAAGDVAAD